MQTEKMQIDRNPGRSTSMNSAISVFNFHFPESVARFVTPELTRFGTRRCDDNLNSLNHTIYGYLRGAESLARALPK
jgi:hypothetical protein